MLIKQKVSACFSAFIHDIEVPADDMDAEKELEIERLEPGVIEYLPPGKDIKFATPPMPPTGTYEAFVNNVLHSVAAGVGVSYEALTGNLEEVNFSSARMGWLEFGRNIDSWRKHMLIPQFCDKVMLWFLEAAEAMGVSTEGVTNTWTPPRRELIDPTKEIPAKIKAIRAGIETLSDVIRQNGGDPTTQFQEIKKDNDILDRLGLVLDSDPRKVTAAGIGQTIEDD
jgi:lambda family phage portal protein